MNWVINYLPHKSYLSKVVVGGELNKVKRGSIEGVYYTKGVYK